MFPTFRNLRRSGPIIPPRDLLFRHHRHSPHHFPWIPISEPTRTIVGFLGSLGPRHWPLPPFGVIVLGPFFLWNLWSSRCIGFSDHSSIGLGPQASGLGLDLFLFSEVSASRTILGYLGLRLQTSGLSSALASSSFRSPRPPPPCPLASFHFSGHSVGPSGNSSEPSFCFSFRQVFFPSLSHPPSGRPSISEGFRISSLIYF
ncbi:hypothetical protein FB451DRAFT_776503 [Mycena latifolia]|nr:hypothetical protein FB451DRAFT_776503 [Mycena latifolia]